ncbi:MAG: aldo/keto reductase, partial [Acidimicrobiales bacterium]
YSLVDRRPERDLLGWAQEHGRLVIAYSPLAQGLLSGRYSASRRPGGMRAMRPLFLPANLERAAGLLDVLGDVAASHDATPAQVALAWLVHQPNVVVIPGASSARQVESNAAAADLELSDDEVRRVGDASDSFQPTSGLAALPDMLRARLPW